jgi:hypothetical protein
MPSRYAALSRALVRVTGCGRTASGPPVGRDTEPMPIPEPDDDLGLWSKVRARVPDGWPQADEDMVRTMAEGWRQAAEELARVGEVDDVPLDSAWPDLVGGLFRARVKLSRVTAATAAEAATALSDQASLYAAEVTAAKTDIRAMIAENVPRYLEAVRLQRRVGEDLATPFVEKLAAMVDQRIDTAVAVLEAGGGIPDPPDPPTPDDGAGQWDSEPATAELLSLHDSLSGTINSAGVLTSSLGVIPNGLANFDHYLDNTGDTQFVATEDVLEDVPGLRSEVREQVDGAVQRATAEAAANGTYGTPIPIATTWREFNITPEENRDWHYAIGNVQHAVTGTVTVHAPDQPGAEPRVEIDYDVHLYDRYNWDNIAGKQAEIAGVPLPDEKFGPLHRAGLAQEYDIRGIPGETHHEER